MLGDPVVGLLPLRVAHQPDHVARPGAIHQGREALDHLVALADRRFDEHEPTGGPTAEMAPAHGSDDDAPMAASPGIAIGPAFTLRTIDVAVPHDAADDTLADVASEWRRVRTAIAEVRREIQRIRAKTARDGGESEHENNRDGTKWIVTKRRLTLPPRKIRDVIGNL